ncbi:hypothetical protein BOTCAL_0013g00540 [Botryotinia calthae]|uniref:Uncharacterized protein n=1 Tax=Botryotinia calthae TaxID=38488 RepID=A0A4Y8DG66_9HELO|nr:hypothetical protein BOTCAL_0013g00540 [Botryotinia calthae]
MTTVKQTQMGEIIEFPLADSMERQYRPVRVYGAGPMVWDHEVRDFLLKENLSYLRGFPLPSCLTIEIVPDLEWEQREAEAQRRREEKAAARRRTNQRQNERAARAAALRAAGPQPAAPAPVAPGPPSPAPPAPASDVPIPDFVPTPPAPAPGNDGLDLFLEDWLVQLDSCLAAPGLKE